MKKPNHEYYNIQELIKKWELYDNTITEKDLLKWGSSGQLQFSIRIIPSEELESITLSMYTEILEDDPPLPESEKHYKMYNKEMHLCERCKIQKGETRYIKVASRTIDNFLNSEREKKITPILLPICDRFENNCTKKCIIDSSLNYDIYHKSFNGSLLSLDSYQEEEDPDNIYTGTKYKSHDFFQIGKDDIVVTIDEVKRFEEQFSLQEERIPPYIDPENEFYSVTLDVAIKTWKAIFIDKKNLGENSAGKAGKKYINSSKNDYAELLSKNGITLTDTLAGHIVKIATGKYSPRNGNWDKLKKKQ